MLLEDHNHEPWFIPRRARFCKDSILNRFSDTDLYFHRVDIIPLDEDQYSCLENPIDRGAWWARVHGITKVGHDLATRPPPPPSYISWRDRILRSLAGSLGILHGIPSILHSFPIVLTDYTSMTLYVAALLSSHCHVQLFVTSLTAACLHCLLEFANIHVHWVGDVMNIVYKLLISLLVVCTWTLC